MRLSEGIPKKRKLNETKPPTRRSKRNKPLKPETAGKECEICTDTKPSDQMYSNPNCSHVFCNDCVGKHVQAKLEKHRHAILCPEMRCREPIEYGSCTAIVPPDALEKWGKLLAEASVSPAQTFYCPFKDCSAMMFRDPDEAIVAAECGACHRLFCARCSTPWHPDVECEVFQSKEKAREDVTLRNLAREKKWSRCPNCKHVVEKVAGCDHMTCRCHHTFRYSACGKWSSN